MQMLTIEIIKRTKVTGLELKGGMFRWRKKGTPSHKGILL